MTKTHMRREIEEIPQAVARLLDRGTGAIRASADDLRKIEPLFVASIARGSSDHAALFLKYACELTLAITNEPGAALAQIRRKEAALKFKETSQVHAESYSSAEVLHGPVSIVGADYPVLALASGDAAEASLVAVADGLTANGAKVVVTSSSAMAATILPSVRTGHGLTDPLALIVSFYAFVEGFSRSRGYNPDAPRNLRKVTETV